MVGPNPNWRGGGFEEGPPSPLTPQIDTANLKPGDPGYSEWQRLREPQDAGDTKVEVPEGADWRDLGTEEIRQRAGLELPEEDLEDDAVILTPEQQDEMMRDAQESEKYRQEQRERDREREALEGPLDGPVEETPEDEGGPSLFGLSPEEQGNLAEGAAVAGGVLLGAGLLTAAFVVAPVTTTVVAGAGLLGLGGALLGGGEALAAEEDGTLPADPEASASEEGGFGDFVENTFDGFGDLATNFGFEEDPQAEAASPAEADFAAEDAFAAQTVKSISTEEEYDENFALAEDPALDQDEHEEWGIG
ncbi:hypothetical protein [Gloeobacter morelensis]|uniref:Uncharacterized protein n=1 Tax=Gloeobacter morelensis MG652769 TaxID=2781736 RepID=A0ABY3PI59_9CYAN|nr:hypothetical protein [Gloeobacter morelensis]UFP93346.1 hypothetical protein ISF26_16270 [Gloeobacter morelensis MG652769]